MLDRKTAPPFKRSTIINLPAPEIISLNNSLNIYHLKDVKQEITKVEIVFNAGKWFDPKPGVSHFTSQMLDKGTAKLTSSEIAKYFDQQGAFIEINPGADFVSVALYALNKNLDKVFQTFLEIITESTFPERELDQMRQAFLQNLQISKQKTSYLASKAINKNVYGENHPYGKSIEETDALNLKQNDLVKYHTHFRTPFKIFIVGKSTPFVVSQLSTAFQINSSNGRSINSTTKNNSLLTERIEKENSTQATIRLGKRSITRIHEDYFDLIFLNHLLGGYFGSRLMKNIREEKGLTYGIYSSINALKNDSMFLIGADVNKERIDLVLTEIKNELNDICNNPLSEKEVSLAKSHFIGTTLIDMASPFSVMEKIKRIQLFDLDPDFYQKLFDKVESFSTSTQDRIANTYLRSESFIEVVAY